MTDDATPPPSDGDDASDEPARDDPSGGGSALRGSRRIHPAVWIAAVLAVVVIAGGAVLLTHRPQEYKVTVPAGTGERIAKGEQVELIPRDLDLSVGDTMIIENQDNRNHTVGPFAVRSGETLTYTFSNAGVFKGACSVHPSGEVTITVA